MLNSEPTLFKHHFVLSPTDHYFLVKDHLFRCSQRFNTRKRRKMHTDYITDFTHHTTLAHAPAPHKLHPPAPHEKPAPAPPPQPVCTNANARVRSTSRQSGEQIAPRRRGMLSPCLCSLPLWRAALRASRSSPPGPDSLHLCRASSREQDNHIELELTLENIKPLFRYSPSHGSTSLT